MYAEGTSHIHIDSIRQSIAPQIGLTVKIVLRVLRVLFLFHFVPLCILIVTARITLFDEFMHCIMIFHPSYAVLHRYMRRAR